MTSNENFIGPLKVEMVVDKGDGSVDITYANGDKESMLMEIFNIVATPEQKDWNYVHNTKFEYLSKEMIPLIAKYDLQYYEAEALFEYLKTQVRRRYERAISYLWTKDDSKFIAGIEPVSMFKFRDAMKIVNALPERANDESLHTQKAK